MHDSEFTPLIRPAPASQLDTSVTAPSVLSVCGPVMAPAAAMPCSSGNTPASFTPSVPCPATPPAIIEPPARQFHVLYLFAGMPRRADIKAELMAIAAASSREVAVEEVDICRGSGHDMLDDRVFNICLHKIRQRHYDVVIVTPPCNTFSRARCNKGTGPPPIRSRVYPWGFPWLYGVRKDKIDTANNLMRKSFEVLRLCGEMLIPYLFEFPEDLGGCRQLSPASAWQLPELRNIAADTHATSYAIYQDDYGAPYMKPTVFFVDIAGRRHLRRFGLAGGGRRRFLSRASSVEEGQAHGYGP